jgi:Cof subfamily protein (haloacid dehalogenase superfamily)
MELIVLDIDGTLLDSDNHLPKSSEKMIRALIDQGKHITLCTGRCYPEVHPIIDHLGIHDPYGVSGGSAIYDPVLDAVIYFSLMRTDQILSLVDMAHTFGMGILAHTVKELLCEVADPDWEFIQTLETMRGYGSFMPRRVMDITQQISTGIIRLNVFSRTLQLEDILLKIQKRNLDVHAIKMTRTIEIANAGIHKGTALQKIAGFLEIPLEKTAAIGDSLNDVEFLKCAGYGIAMGNAPEGLKQVADFVAPTSDENGLFIAFEKLASLEKKN